MRLNKIKDSYNDYKLEVSWGQLLAIKQALGEGTPDPVSDELAAELEWYLANVPGPGQNEEEFKAREEAESSALPDENEDEGSIPMPPGTEEIESVAGEGPVEQEGGGTEEIDLGAEEGPGGEEETETVTEEPAGEEYPEPPRE